jgi:SAM-dependent methyltransferase
MDADGNGGIAAAVRSPTDAVRDSYDAVASSYADLFRHELDDRPLDRAVLSAFAEAVGDRLVLDVGSGPGTATAFLAERGVNVTGIDLAPRMVEVARREHPGVRFEVASMTALPVPAGWLGGIVAWFSIIHTPLDALPALFAGFHRALGTDGELLLAFQVRDADVRVEHAFGHPVELEAFSLRPDLVERALVRAGFTIYGRVLREPEGDAERVPRAYLLARRDAVSASAD